MISCEQCGRAGPTLSYQYGRLKARGSCAIMQRFCLCRSRDNAVKRRGFILYPGWLTTVQTFHVGCLGHFGEEGMRAVIVA